MEGKTNFSRRLRLKQFDGLTWLAPYFTTDLRHRLDVCVKKQHMGV